MWEPGSEVPWELTAENRPSVRTDLSSRPLSERLRLLPSMQSLYDGSPGRVAPDLREAQEKKRESDRLAALPRAARRRARIKEVRRAGDASAV